jgi:hypothetical protein
MAYKLLYIYQKANDVFYNDNNDYLDNVTFMNSPAFKPGERNKNPYFPRPSLPEGRRGGGLFDPRTEGRGYS